MAKKADTKFSPTDTDEIREANYFPAETDYWDAARSLLQDAEDALFNAEVAHEETRRKFLNGDPQVPAEDVRVAELNLERARRQQEIAAEPLAWLDRRRAKDAHSRHRNGMPSAIADRQVRLGHVRQWIKDATGAEAGNRLAVEKDATRRRVEESRRRYLDGVADLEHRVTVGKVAQAEGQAAADVLARRRDEQIAAEEASLKAVLERHDERLARLRDEERELVAWLAQYRPTSPVRLVRK